MLNLGGLLGLNQCFSFLWDLHSSSYVIFKAGNPRANCKELSSSLRAFVLKTSHGAQPKGRCCGESFLLIRCTGITAFRWYFWKLLCWIFNCCSYISSCSKFSAKIFTKWKTPQKYCFNHSGLNLDVKRKGLWGLITGVYSSKQTKIPLNSQGDKVQWTVSDLFFINLHWVRKNT